MGADFDPVCELCGGLLGLLGTLGSVDHYQCRDCGAEYRGEWTLAGEGEE